MASNQSLFKVFFVITSVIIIKVSANNIDRSQVLSSVYDSMKNNHKNGPLGVGPPNHNNNLDQFNFNKRDNFLDNRNKRNVNEKSEPSPYTDYRIYGQLNEVAQP